MRGGEDDPCVWMWMVVEDPKNWIDQHQNHDHKETSKGDKSDAKVVVVAVPVPWAPVACHTIRKQLLTDHYKHVIVKNKRHEYELTYIFVRRRFLSRYVTNSMVNILLHVCCGIMQMTITIKLNAFY